VYRNENIGREIVLSEMKKNTREESIYDEIKDLNGIELLHLLSYDEALYLFIFIIYV
jgi:hypothetical protein